MFDRARGPEHVREILRQLRPLIGQEADTIYHAYLLEDEIGREQLELYLEALLFKKLPPSLSAEHIQLVPPEPILADGEYKLGTILYHDRSIGDFGLREAEWIQHVGIFGRSGAGKTNMGYMVLRELKKHGKPFLVFDWKRNYRDLIALSGMEDLEIYTVGRPFAPLGFNPLIPPAGTPPKTWLKKIIEVIAHAYLLGNGVLHLLQVTLDRVYEKFGVYAGTQQRYPTFRDLLEEIQNYEAKGREAGWLSSTLRALSALCFGDMDTVVNQENNAHLGLLLERPVILEFDVLSQADKIFFIQALLLWIHHRRMAEGEREHFKHAIIIEEAHHVLSGERRSLIGGQSVMEITFREIREYGESIVILDQHPSQISLPALGNTYTTICLNLKHSKDVAAMSQAMLMDGEERDLLGALEIGQAVVKLQGRVTTPFLIKIPEVEIRKGTVSDQGLADRPRTLNPRMISFSDFASAETAGQTTTASEPVSLASLEQKFLRDIEQYPDSGIAARYKRLALSVRQGQKIKNRVLASGWIRETMTSTSIGTKRIITLTESGILVATGGLS